MNQVTIYRVYIPIDSHICSSYVFHRKKCFLSCWWSSIKKHTYLLLPCILIAFVASTKVFFVYRMSCFEIRTRQFYAISDPFQIWIQRHISSIWEKIRNNLIFISIFWIYLLWAKANLKAGHHLFSSLENIER